MTAEPGIIRKSTSIIRTCVGGLLMGIANLIPGVSGGTMILALGLYPEFIDSVADVTALRLRRRRIVFLGLIGASALVAIVGLADAILYLLFHHDSAMYALFIGLTLGGAPSLFRSVQPFGAVGLVFTLAGMGLMVAVARMTGGPGFSPNAVTDLVCGTVAAVTMVLPGISGSYMLLILGQYDRIVGSIPDREFGIIIPVGIGVVLGVVLLSNTLKFLLRRFERPTIGFLLGMLLGSMIGLWPFGRQPSPDALERRTAAELARFAEIKGVGAHPGLSRGELAEHILAGWSERNTENDYASGSVALAALLVVGGFLTTAALSRRGGGGVSGHSTPARTAADPVA